MSRIKNFTRNLVFSYLQLGAGVIYSLVSIPLILHYLPKAEFGMWATLLQLMGYMALVDLGMTSAAGRILVDYKDKRDGDGYSSLVKTSFLVSAAQGVIVIVLMLTAAPLLAAAMKVPPEHRQLFIDLMRWQGTIVAFGFAVRPLALLLYAHQREDIANRVGILSSLLSLGLVWWLLTRGVGVYAFIYVNAVMGLLTPACLGWYCRRMGLLPRAAEQGRCSWAKFKECFSFGKDVFLMSIGHQLITSSQTVIVSRTLGLEAAAVWAVGTKMFNLIFPLMCRPYGASIPGMYELQARGEATRLRNRFQEMVVFTGSLGVFFGVSLALCNSLFVGLWTNGRIAWAPLNDVLLGAWLFLMSLQTTHCNFVSVTKQIGGMRYIYFIEGLCFVALALFAAEHFAVPGIVAASMFCTLVFSYQYSLRRSRDHFHESRWNLATVWVRPCLKFAAVFVPVAGLTWFLGAGLPPLPRLCLNAAVASLAGGWLFLRLGLTRVMLEEANLRLPPPVARGLRFLISCRA